MPRVNPEILVWARETAGLTVDLAVAKLGINEAHGIPAIDRLKALESGDIEPTRPMLVKMAKHYRRPLLTFYLTRPPRTGDRGEDFRTLPDDRSPVMDATLDALIRNVQARQGMVRALLEDDDDNEPIATIGSLRRTDSMDTILTALRNQIPIDIHEFWASDSVESAFSALRNAVESVGAFVLLIGNLGSHHSNIDVETFRGFALADSIAPFIVINENDARTAWSFTLLHEFAHLLIGASGVSGARADTEIERLCNDVAGEFLIPSPELDAVNVQGDTDHATSIDRISTFASQRNLSRSMIAYRLYRNGHIARNQWMALSADFRDQWFRIRAARKEQNRLRDGGPSYFVVRRHRVGNALLGLIGRAVSEGTLPVTKAGTVLGVKATNVAPLLHVPFLAKPA